MHNSRFTKKSMIEDFERLYDHAALLDLYLFDTQTRATPDATELYSAMKDGCLESDVRIELWRAKSASGGFRDGFACCGDGCPSNDHSNEYRKYKDYKGQVHTGDGGYALNHRWL